MSNKPQTTNHKYLLRLGTTKKVLLLLSILLFDMGCGKETNNTKKIDAINTKKIDAINTKKIDAMAMALAHKDAMDALGGCKYFKSSTVLSNVGKIIARDVAVYSSFDDRKIISSIREYAAFGNVIFCSGAFDEALQAGHDFDETFFGEAGTNKTSAFIFFSVEGLKLIEDLGKHLKEGEHEACEAVIKSFKALDTHTVYALGNKAGDPLKATAVSKPLPDEHKAAIKSLGESAEEILKEYKKKLGIE